MTIDRLASEHQLGQPVFRLKGRKFGSIPTILLMWAIAGAVLLGLLAALFFFLGLFNEAWTDSAGHVTIGALKLAGIILLVGIPSVCVLVYFNAAMTLALFDRGVVYQLDNDYHVIPYAEVASAKQTVEFWGSESHEKQGAPLGGYFYYYRLRTGARKKFCFTTVAFGNGLVQVGSVMLHAIHRQQYVAFKQQFDSGQALQFGAIALSQSELRCGNRRLPWSALDSIRLTEGRCNYWLELWRTNGEIGRAHV